MELYTKLIRTALPMYLHCDMVTSSKDLSTPTPHQINLIAWIYLLASLVATKSSRTLCATRYRLCYGFTVHCGVPCIGNPSPQLPGVTPATMVPDTLITSRRQERDISSQHINWQHPPYNQRKVHTLVMHASD